MNLEKLDKLNETLMAEGLLTQYDDMPDFLSFWHAAQKFPYCTWVIWDMHDGLPVFVDMGDDIKNIIGWTREELIGRSVKFILPNDFDMGIIEKTAKNLQKYGTSPKHGTNLHKDGSIIESFGALWMSGDKVVEIVWKL